VGLSFFLILGAASFIEQALIIETFKREFMKHRVVNIDFWHYGVF
jgi:hypothetical protein